MLFKGKKSNLLFPLFSFWDNQRIVKISLIITHYSVSIYLFQIYFGCKLVY